MNKVAILTGSTGEIGTSILEKLLELDYIVYAIGRNFENEKFKKIYQQLVAENNSKKLCTIYYDFKNINNISKLVQTIYNKEQRIDLLVCAHGISLNSLAIDTKIEDILEIINVNQISTIVMSNEVIKYMLKTDAEKNIINISSIWGTRAASCESIYASTKAGIEMYSKSIAVEYAKSNIRVNTIAPGYIDTKMNKFTEIENEKIMQEIPLGKFGNTEEIAKTVEYIINSKYLTAQTISINGGWLA